MTSHVGEMVSSDFFTLGPSFKNDHIQVDTVSVQLLNEPTDVT